MNGTILEWIKVLGPIVISWPLVVLLVVLVFKASILRILDRFIESPGSKAEIGPIKLELGNPVLPPQYRDIATTASEEKIDLSSYIGQIRDTGPEGATVGFALAYTLQAAIKRETNHSVTLSPRGIYVLAKRYDEWPGENYEGTSLVGGLKAVCEVGAYTEVDWPYSNKLIPKADTQPSYKISGYSELKGTEQILNTLRENRVVVARIQVTNDFDRPDENGRVTIRLPLQQIGAKAVCLIGYDAESAEFMFANDWGTAWGQDGFGRIRDTDLAKILEAAYWVEL